MEAQGYLDKMETELRNGTVQYALKLDDSLTDMNNLLGQRIELSFNGKIRCVGCGKVIYKAYGQGFCFPCLQASPLASECIMNPEKCKAHLGISRDMEWSKGHCLTPHIVYLAWSSHVKVGVTRQTQVPTRWIDQGASQAIRLAFVPNRHMAGVIEVFLKQHYSDKTNWQQMLVNRVHDPVNLVEEKHKALSLLPPALSRFAADSDEVTYIRYPIGEVGQKVASLGFDKQKSVSGTLTGIKGQYLVFDHLYALNVRKHTGYGVDLAY
ncbi:MAG: DUF2797 domain-containing protein [Breznakibacter sp.]